MDRYMIKIGLDAMGGDFAPEQTVLGAYQAVKKFDDIEVYLYGIESKSIYMELNRKFLNL